MNRPCAVSVRPACLGEARAMAEMSRQLIEAGLVWRYTLSRVAALIADAEALALLACDGPQLRDFAVRHVGDNVAHLSLLAAGRLIRGWPPAAD